MFSVVMEGLQLVKDSCFDMYIKANIKVPGTLKCFEIISKLSYYLVMVGLSLINIFYGNRKKRSCDLTKWIEDHMVSPLEHRPLAEGFPRVCQQQMPSPGCL